MNHKRINIRPSIGGAVYILPNLLTTGNLFFGFFSIIKAMQGDFLWASAAILLASIFDVLDGRVARLTRGSSEFGVQYDSLCDLVSFGLAPAFLMYQYALHGLGRFGWSLCFIFLACGALRLARFNVQSSIGKANDDFTGLPIPIPAGVIACYVSLTSDLHGDEFEAYLWTQSLYEFISTGVFHKWFLLIMAPLLAFLMVSNVRYRSHKTVKLVSIKPFRLLAILVIIVGIAAYKPALAGFIFFFGFSLSGLLEWIMGWKKATDEDDIFQPIEQDSSIMEPGSMEPLYKDDERKKDRR
jgi:CDP-diacylglycerol--serine O-phosphatidyltransferase